MLNDLSYAFRTLRKSPVFTITVVITIALAIGASTAIFSVTNGVLMRQLPYKDPERLVLACSDLQARNVKDFPVGNATFLDRRNGAKNNFEDFADKFDAPRTNLSGKAQLCSRRLITVCASGCRLDLNHPQRPLVGFAELVSN